MTPRAPMKLFSPNACVRIGQWNVRTMHETGKCAQAVSEMRRFNLDILSISEMRWNGCGKMVAKVLCRVLLNRMKGAVNTKLRDEQAGFRKGRSYTDRIATLRIIVEQSAEWQSSVYICFVDFQKTFDSIHRQTLWKLLRRYGLLLKVVNIIRKLYEGFTAQVVHNGRFTEKFQMQTGVRQGCLLSPILFLITLDWVTREANGSSDKGLPWQLVSTLEDLELADDIALLMLRLEDIRCKMEDLNAFGEKVGLKMNVRYLRPS